MTLLAETLCRNLMTIEMTPQATIEICGIWGQCPTIHICWMCNGHSCPDVLHGTYGGHRWMVVQTKCYFFLKIKLGLRTFVRRLVLLYCNCILCESVHTISYRIRSARSTHVTFNITNNWKTVHVIHPRQAVNKWTCMLANACNMAMDFQHM